MGPRSLTAQEAAEIQRIANKYDTPIYVGGSRAQGQGRNIARPELEAGVKGPNGRSDIDYIFNPNHPQAREIHRELQRVGQAGEPHPNMSFYRGDRPYTPERLGSAVDGDAFRFRFEPNKTP